MNRFRYLYGFILGELLLKHANARVEICSTRRFCHEVQQLKVVWMRLWRRSMESGATNK